MNKSTYIGLMDIYKSRSCIFFIISSSASSFDIRADDAPSIRVRNLSEALSILPTESRLSLEACIDRSTANRSIGEVEFFFADAESPRRWFLAKFVPTEPGDLQCVFMDITSLKTREERTRLILGEFAHRIKNNMTMVQSIARLTLKTTRSDEKALAIFQARLSALANAQNLLIRNDWRGASLSDVVEEATKPFDRDFSPFHVTGDEIFISSRLAKVMIFALHELCTNAMKYGALSTGDGEVLVSWRVADVDGVRTLLFSWREQHGPAIHSVPGRRGFGTRMIERWLAQEAGGTATLRYLEEGLLFEFSAPFVAVDDGVTPSDIRPSGEDRII
ncbi:sensor histidine kinase [Rhizobium oryzicola]|uniref:histidine kinase n=1 Tax=Rhizobium oryzicola TaxID=1232668 RepID=A0ABT8SYE0_9HYPH|nr:sensor histidine kinase [Rhizobium oryzicola]MDO1583452.1 sensor histidine kinase [Rhizobium oryzicola]